MHDYNVTVRCPKLEFLVHLNFVNDSFSAEISKHVIAAQVFLILAAVFLAINIICCVQTVQDEFNINEILTMFGLAGNYKLRGTFRIAWR